MGASGPSRLPSPWLTGARMPGAAVPVPITRPEVGGCRPGPRAAKPDYNKVPPERQSGHFRGERPRCLRWLTFAPLWAKGRKPGGRRGAFALLLRRIRRETRLVRSCALLAARPRVSRLRGRAGASRGFRTRQVRPRDLRRRLYRLPSQRPGAGLWDELTAADGSFAP